MSNKNIAERFAPGLKNLTNFMAKIKEENADAVAVLRKTAPNPEKTFSTRSMEDKVVSTNVSNTSEMIKLHLTIFNNPIKDELVQNITTALSMIPLPYMLKLDVSYFVHTEDGDEKAMHGSEGSRLQLQHFVMRDLADLKGFMSDIGYEYTMENNFDRSDEVLINKVISHHDAQFGFFSHSKFSFQSIAFVELWVQSDKFLVEQWQG